MNAPVYRILSKLLINIYQPTIILSDIHLLYHHIGWLKSLWNDLIIIDRSHCSYLPSDIPQPGCRMHPSCQEFWCRNQVVEATNSMKPYYCPEIKHGDSWKIPISCVHIYICMYDNMNIYIYIYIFMIIYNITYIYTLLLYIYIYILDSIPLFINNE